MARKLGRTAEERMAIIRNQASELLWYGSIETTVDRAKEVRSYAESMITLAVNTYEDTVKVQKTVTNDKGEKVVMEFTNDGPRKLAARRKLMASLRDLQEIKEEKESKSAYKERTKDIKHPLIEKVFEHAVFYADRAAKLGQRGGYTRIIKLGQRRGDGAEMAKLELVKNTEKSK